AIVVRVDYVEISLRIDDNAVGPRELARPASLASPGGEHLPVRRSLSHPIVPGVRNVDVPLVVAIDRSLALGLEGRTAFEDPLPEAAGRREDRQDVVRRVDDVHVPARAGGQSVGPIE